MRWLADEAFRVGVVSDVQDDGALLAHGVGASMVDVGGGVQAQTAVTVLVVVPGEEALAMGSGGLDRVEAAGEVGPVFQGLELRLGERGSRWAPADVNGTG